MVFLRLFGSIIFSFCLMCQSFAIDKLDENGKPRESGIAVVRIWNSDLPNRIAGHVSLETKGSYISLWPWETDREEFEHLKFVKEAPAWAVENYEKDLELEGKKEDHNYIIKLNDTKVDNFWAKLKETTQPSKTIQNKLSEIVLKKMKWYALGRTDEQFEKKDEGKIYLNCASMTMLALAIGEVPVGYIDSLLSQKDVLKKLGRDFGQYLKENQNGQQTGEFLYKNSPLLGTIMPYDIQNILDEKITDTLKRDIQTELVSKGKLDVKEWTSFFVLDALDITIGKMAQILSKQKTEIYSLNDQDFMKEVGHFKQEKFVVNQDLIDHIRFIERNRTTLAILGGIGGLVYFFNR